MYQFQVWINFGNLKELLAAFFVPFVVFGASLTLSRNILKLFPAIDLGSIWKRFFPKQKNALIAKPSKPNFKSSGPKKVRMTWKEPEHSEEIGQIRAYRVKIQNLTGTEETIVHPKDLETKRVKIELPDLKPGVKYRFFVSAICGEHGESKPSKVSGPIVTDHPCDPPGKPVVSQMGTNTVRVEWTAPGHKGNGIQVTGYKIRATRGHTKRWQDVKSVNDEFSTEVNGLKNSTSYKFAVRAICNYGESADSEESEEVHVTCRPKDQFRYKADIISNDIPPVFLLNPNIETNRTDEKHNLRICDFGNHSSRSRKKVMVIVGATGAGKTTLINGMVNYMLGVEWLDKFRFKLIADADELQKKSQSKSQTQWITSYTIHHQDGFRVPYSLTLIDTPGFGDTSGIKRDREITHQIRNFLSPDKWRGIDHVDAIGFVAQSALPRLTPTQQFIFDSIIALFGKDLESNIFMLVTFADGNTPPVLSGIKQAEIPFKKFFKFNNSALFAANDEGVKKERRSSRRNKEEHFEEMFWDMGLESFRTLFEFLDKTPRQNLRMTREVLKERYHLEKTVQELQELTKGGFEKLEEIRETQELVQQYTRDEATYRDYTTTLVQEAAKTVNVDPGNFTTNCTNCNYTCHYPCPFGDDNSKIHCEVMRNGYCTVCPNKCSWNSHKNMPFRFVMEKKEEQRDSADLKQKYEIAVKEKKHTEELLVTLKREMDEIRVQAKKLAVDVKKRFNSLQGIALKPNPIKSAEYIDMLIDSEKQQAKEGWQNRIDQLRNLREQAEIMFKARDDQFDPFAQLKVGENEE